MGVSDHEFTVAGSALAWWREVGVDCAVSEAHFEWLAGDSPKAKPKSLPTPTHTKKISIQTGQLPATLAEYSEWLASADIPEAGPPHCRLMPFGPDDARLMILTDFPDIEDVETKNWFSGELASLFDRMLAALGHMRETVYVAALCPGRPAGGMIAASSIEPLAAIARHHIALVKPQQLWLMGSAPSRAVLGFNDAAARGQLHKVNLDGCMVETIATAHPRTFDAQKSMRAAAWIEMQRLLDGSKA
jgi:uracil-DNA glycosylase